MDEPGTARLTNDDFRKLLMTPRAPGATSSLGSSGSVRDAISKSNSAAKKSSTEKHEARRKKKNFYSNLKKSEDTILSDLADKYRDRAKERRDGSTTEYQNVDASRTGAYRAVADLKSGFDAAERRRKLIQESKFLGGDIEHTHLVKGLDYALLQKVRSEIVVKEAEQELEMERLAEDETNEEETKAPEKSDKPEKADKNDDKPDELEFKTILGKNIHRLIGIQRSRHVERNEMFAPGRMAYHIELEDVNVESDIPTTLIRSKTEIPTSMDTQTLTTNDIVINKLAQILSYLRQGGRGKKKDKKRDKDKPLFKVPEIKPVASSSSSKSRSTNIIEDSIYGDIGDYKPSRSSSSSRREDDRRSDRRVREHGHSSKSSSSSDRQKTRPYFDKQEEEPVEPQYIPTAPKLSNQLMSKLQAEPEGYAECYPGLEEMNDAIEDSDEEVDYTKMDLGNKKGPIGRWDFDTQEEYSDYMSTKEALPKACFQYGVKMTDGRKTRKNKTEKSEKAELDREWQKIQNIMNKRKGEKGGDEIDFKKSKY